MHFLHVDETIIVAFSTYPNMLLLYNFASKLVCECLYSDTMINKFLINVLSADIMIQYVIGESP